MRFRQVTLLPKTSEVMSEVQLGPGSACFSLNFFILDTRLSFRPETADEESQLVALVRAAGPEVMSPRLGPPFQPQPGGNF